MLTADVLLEAKFRKVEPNAYLTSQEKQFCLTLAYKNTSPIVVNIYVT